jgi:TRAP-type C4-dicarboxylate transport system permease small subunit
MPETHGLPVARRIDAQLRRLEAACSEVSAFMLAAIMVIVVLDVGFRYLLNAPLVWSFDVITLYLTVGLFFFALSDTLEDNAHVWVDVAISRVGPRLQHLFFAIGYGLSWVAFAAIGWMAALRACASFTRSEVTAGLLKMPVWVSSAFVTVGIAVLLCRLAYRTFGHAAAAATGEPIIPLPGSHDVHTGTE